FILSLRQKLNENIKIIKVFRVGTQNLKLETWNLKPIDYLLFDTDSQSFGGTGQTFDWNILNNLEIPKPYFLSGGISLENFENIKDLNQKPFALDINSKFETEPGIKDVEKVKKIKTLLQDEL
ncbi:MAG: phosphoribosylanthranilate isomerase, partial [Flavobacteriales bacterium]|nr:phosphoribosylanthranilate isomerase [Flavobacteriales bacterium]